MGPRVAVSPQPPENLGHSMKGFAVPLNREPQSTDTEKSFQGWRLLGVIGIVVVILAIVSAAVDFWVLGPLLERAV